MPLIEVKNDAHKRMLATKSVKVRKNQAEAVKLVKRAVDQAKEYWIGNIRLRQWLWKVKQL